MRIYILIFAIFLCSCYVDPEYQSADLSGYWDNKTCTVYLSWSDIDTAKKYYVERNGEDIATVEERHYVDRGYRDRDRWYGRGHKYNVRGYVRDYDEEDKDDDYGYEYTESFRSNDVAIFVPPYEREQCEGMLNKQLEYGIGAESKE